MRKLVIIGSNSIHCKRYIAGVVASAEYSISLITNQLMSEFLSLPQTSINFSLHNLKAVGQIKRTLVAINPDVVHIHQANSYAWHALRAIAKLAKRPKVVLTAWGSDVLMLPQQNKLFYKIVQYNLRNADIITADSFFMSARIAELLGEVERPIHTLNFGIDEVHEPIALAAKQPLILSNRLHKPLYRVDKIIQAFTKLYTSGAIAPEYKLLVAGGGEETENLKQLATELNIAERVIFTGMLSYSELIEYYKRAQVFVSVPTSDGTSSSLLEAMAYGCIPVLANLPANLEWVIDQINGFIAPNVADLAEQMQNALNLSANLEAYAKLYAFNYALIRQKALFKTNLAAFMRLYG